MGACASRDARAGEKVGQRRLEWIIDGNVKVTGSSKREDGTNGFVKSVGSDKDVGGMVLPREVRFKPELRHGPAVKVLACGMPFKWRKPKRLQATSTTDLPRCTGLQVIFLRRIENQQSPQMHGWNAGQW